MNVIVFAEVSAANVIGGAERALREQCCGLVKRGHRVSVIARAPQDDNRENVAYEGVREHRYNVTAIGALQFVIQSIKKTIGVFDAVTGGRQVEACVVHQSLAGLGCMLFRRRRAQQWVYVCHSLSHEEYTTRNKPGASLLSKIAYRLHWQSRFWIEKYILRKCARVVVLSQFTKDRVIRNHQIPDDRIVIIPGGVDRSIFKPPATKKQARERLGLPAEKFILFSVRNLVPRMGLENLIAALPLMEIGLGNIQLYIGGKGPLREELEALIEKHNLQKNVELLGFISEEDLLTYYQSADLFVLPTIFLEGFGLVTVEALACGTPVLGTPIAATPEILAPIDPRLVAAGSDAASLASSLKRCIELARNQPQKWDQIRQKGLTAIENVYNWEVHSFHLEQVLKGHSQNDEIPGELP